MNRIKSAVEKISRIGAIGGGLLLLVASVLICIDVVMRYTISRTIGGADELAGYALAIASAWGFSTALLSRSHIRIDTVYVRVRPRLRAVLDLVSLAVLLGFFGMITWHAWGVVSQSWTSHSHSLSEIEAPLVIPQLLWFGGLVFFVATALLLLVRGLMAWWADDLASLFAMIGSKSALAEAEEEIAAVAHGLEQEKKQ